MPRQSKTDHVRKRCQCVKWKTCTHPWHVDYREGWDVDAHGTRRRRALRKPLRPLVGREPIDFADAKAEAKRAIVAWKDGRDATTLLPGDAPTLTAVLEAYGQRPGGAPIDKYQGSTISNAVVNGRPLGAWRAGEITRDMIEAFRRQRPPVAGNRDLALLRAVFNWAVLHELVATTPFKIGTVTAVKLSREEPRTRRLAPGEEERLLAAAHGLLRDVIVGALETGCRTGELLSLQWDQVRGDLFLPAGKTKAKKPRRVPISTVLRELLDRRRLDPAGEPLPPAAFVFGDEVGRPRRSPLTTLWENAVLTAHGVTPQRSRTGHLAPECRARLKTINLHLHDLRREAGSRWMDAGVPLSTIQRWLGHYNISQTSTYLAATGGGDADAMYAFEVATGRVTKCDLNDGSNSPEPTASDLPLHEKTEQNRTIH